MSISGPLPTNIDAQHPTPVAVFVHVHYPDVWQDIARQLAERFDAPFRLVVTSAVADFSPEIPPTPFHLETIFVPTENRGRDIRPFLLALQRMGKFEIGLKLHTKKSTHRLDGGTWRDDILASLVSKTPPPSAFVRAFATQPALGILAPSGFLLPVREWLLTNLPRMRRVSETLASPLSRKDLAQGSFAAGSMFWFRQDALSDFANSALLELFESEKGQTDGTVAHAIERLFGTLAARRGYAILPANMVSILISMPPHGRAEDLDQLKPTEDVSSLFRRSMPARLAATHAPLVLRLYGMLPISLRRMLRTALSGK